MREEQDSSNELKISNSHLGFNLESEEPTEQESSPYDESVDGRQIYETPILRTSRMVSKAAEFEERINLPEIKEWLEQPITRVSLLCVILATLLVVYTTMSPKSHNMYAEAFLYCQNELKQTRLELEILKSQCSPLGKRG